jgi:hypothetical protein
MQNKSLAILGTNNGSISGFKKQEIFRFFAAFPEIRAILDYLFQKKLQKLTE